MNAIIRKKQSPITGIWSNILDQDFFGMPSYEHAAHTLPKVNIIEDDNGYKIELAVPGFEKNDFNIEVDDDVISISLEKEIDATTTYNKREFNFGSFKRAFNLPESAHSAKISANYTSGILNILIPKKEEAKPIPSRIIKVG
ncbi:MAG: Hsp20/alpha crystallin family protein [Bacteroidota bacterium]|nr:Hsp20/alpha crystallin family protein [Bacteroidota bacterium]